MTILSEKIYKKIHAQEDKIRGSKQVPHDFEIVTFKRMLEEIFEGQGRVNYKYAKETLIAYNYCKSTYHYITKESMLNDILSNKRIIFNNYS